MTGETGKGIRGIESAAADFAGLLGKAVVSGVAASLVLALLTLALASTARAQPIVDADRDPRLFEPWSGTPAPSPEGEPTGAGVLWATPATEPEAARPDDEEAMPRPAVLNAPAPLPASRSLAVREPDGELEASNLQIALGGLALAALAVVIALGRRAPAAGRAEPPRAAGSLS